MHAGDVTHVAVLIGHGGGEADVFVAQFEFFLSLVPQAEIEVGVKELALQTWSGGAIGFGLGLRPDQLDGPVDVLFALQENTWAGRTSLQMFLKEVRPTQLVP